MFNYFKQLNYFEKIYCSWAIISILFAIMIAPYSVENITRSFVILFLLVQILLHNNLKKLFLKYSPKIRFILMATILAMVVEGFHMISMPVFLSLRITTEINFTQGLYYYLIDLAFTVPAYLVIFSVIWYFINKYHYKLWNYIIIMGLAQALGDGGIFFFLNAPFMLLFLPYPMTNYHAINIIPFLAIEKNLKESRILSKKAYLVIPAVILTYLICGSIIKVIGKFFGFE